MGILLDEENEKMFLKNILLEVEIIKNYLFHQN